jgi:DNA-binding MarR family transcriptional regulator
MGENSDQRSSFAAALLLESIIRRIYSEKSSCEIQPLQWSILRYLDSSPKTGCTVSKISGFLGVTHAPVVRAITTLTKRGLVTQSENPADARSKLLSLTPKGIAKMTSDPILRVVDYLEAQPRLEREQFKKFIRGMVLSTQGDGFADDAKDTANRR